MYWFGVNLLKLYFLVLIVNDLMFLDFCLILVILNGLKLIYII